MDATRSQIPLKISSLALEEAESLLLRQSLEQLQAGGGHFQILENNNPAAHLVVVNTESELGKNQLASLRPGQVKLIFSNQPVNGKNQISLEKPINLANLTNILHKLCRQMQSQLQSRQPQGEERKQPMVEANTSDSLLKILIQTKNKKQSIRLQHKQIGESFIDGNKQTFKSHASIENIIKSGLDRHEAFTVTSSDKNESPTNYAELHPLTNILWELAINTEEAIFSTSITNATPLKLKAWPNFTRQGFKPEHFKIAAIMARQAISQNALCECLQLEAGMVTQFINGCYAVDLIETKTDEVITSMTSNTSSIDMNQHSGLFKRIAIRLGFQTNE